jgi:hypothetical protein
MAERSRRAGRIDRRFENFPLIHFVAHALRIARQNVLLSLLDLVRLRAHA